jgi:cytochrome c oxidase cbb3-type subunit 2
MTSLGGEGARAPWGPAARVVVIVAALLVTWHGSAAVIEPANAPEVSPGVRDVLTHGLEVYLANCAICHGETGDGNGMAAHMFLIPPRDFRHGLFKFRSTPSGSLPTDEDLMQTVTQGLRWTGMVGRGDLSEGDRRAVVQYVKTLSPRFAAEQPRPSIAVPLRRGPESYGPAPPMPPDLVEKGRQVYLDAGCGTCHGNSGLGDGPSAPGMKDDWGWPTRPSDLTWRPLKRGSTLEATYLTIATGLSGTPMPSYGDSLDGHEIWALVYYLESLVPAGHRLTPQRILGEEQQGWMVVRMHGMMGPGMMGPGMMRRSP